jgi:flagellar FliJ protein
MAKFDFQLEAVLKHRKNREQERRRALAVVQGELTRLGNDLVALDQSVKAANEDMRQNHLTGRLDLTFMAAHRRFLVATQQRAGEIIQKMAGVRRQVEAARRELAAAAKDRKVIEKLREREHGRWVAEINRKETAEMDEIGMQIGFANIQEMSGGEA